VQHYNWSTRKNPSANQSAGTQRGFVMEKRNNTYGYDAEEKRRWKE